MKTSYSNRTHPRGRSLVGALVAAMLLIASALPGMAQRIQPEDLVYLGAFRMPDRPPGAPDEEGWEYGGTAMAYYPHGDPDGPADGFPGSLFGAGFDVTQYIAEITIPVPLISPTKDADALNVATTLQAFHDVRAGLFEGLVEMPRVGMAYLPAQAGQLTDKLHFGWGAHFQEDPGLDLIPSHMWCELDLSNPQTAGAWYIGDYSLYATNDYLFDIPEAWAATYTPGMRLATGRYRDGGWSGRGPSLFAYGPWLDGTPPASGIQLSATPLLLYSNTRGDDTTTFTMTDYQHSDEWSGAAWLTAGSNAAVIFVGTKGAGDREAWYGDTDGPCPNDNCGDRDRGWWSEEFIGQVLFYDPADLAAVAQGTMEPYEPQPYATLSVDPYLYFLRSNQQRYHVGAVSFDRERGLLYLFESARFEEDRTLIHVWSITSGPTGLEDEGALIDAFALDQNFPNPFNAQTAIRFAVPAAGTVHLAVYDMLGREQVVLVDGPVPAGQHQVTFDATRLPSMLYLYRLETPQGVLTRKMAVMK